MAGVKSAGKMDMPMKKTAKLPPHKPGTKKYCPTCNRSVSCPHMK